MCFFVVDCSVVGCRWVDGSLCFGSPLLGVLVLRSRGRVCCPSSVSALPARASASGGLSRAPWVPGHGMHGCRCTGLIERCRFFRSLVTSGTACEVFLASMFGSVVDRRVVRCRAECIVVRTC